MHTHNTHSLLNKLISLTKERDANALECSLAQALFDLIAPVIDGGTKSVVIYHLKDIKKQLFTSVSIGISSRNRSLSNLFKQALTDCFKSGENFSYVQSGESFAKLFPLKNSAGFTMAVIAIEAHITDSRLLESISMLLQIYQNFTGLITDNERDTLTGLLNRKTFEYKINKVLAQVQTLAKRKDDRSNQVHFLAIFDIDHFKRVNDEFGHLIGDEVLLLFSQLMVQTFRSTDPLFRFGGEEFVGIFKCTKHTDIPIILDRFRKKISKFKFPQVGKVTVSIGYTEIFSDDLSTLLIDRADLALYYAKNNGRNRICLYEQLIADGDLQENRKISDIELF